MNSKLSEIEQIFKTLINSESSVTPEKEARFLSLDETEGNLHLKYNADGLTPQQKKDIEDSFFIKMGNLWDENKIFLIPLTKEPSRPDNNKPAQLKVGHGSIGEKKGISGVNNIISIGSGKGGVGKSTFTVNLAITLANQGKKVGIIDADIYGPSLPHMLGMAERRPQANEEQKIIPLEGHGIKFVSFGSFIHADEPVVWRGPMLGGVLNQFFFDTEWGELDFLLIDLPPGTGDVQLSMIQNLNVDGSVIISTPQDMALLDTRKALHMFDKLKLPVVGMVENMSSFICDKCDTEHFLYGTGGVTSTCNELGVGFLGGISMDINLRKSADFGKPYMSNRENFEDSKIWKDYQGIAKKIMEYFSPGVEKKGFLKNMFKKN